jgi:hypothetical protein
MSSDRPLGRREEGSVTVPLRELLAEFEGAAPKSRSTAREDDSGLIDLASLTAQSKGSGPPSPVLAHAQIFPFGAPPESVRAPQPAAPAVAQEPAKAAAPSRKGAWIAAACALVAVAALAGGVSAATLPSGETKTLATALAPFAAQGALVAKAATPPAEPVASTETPAEPQAKIDARTPAHRGPVASVGPSRPKTPNGDKGDTVKKDPPAKPKDPCNGDLMCAMRRATGK